MRRYTEYSDEELLALTDEEISELVDLECAIDGVALLPDPPVQPPEVKAGPDITVYMAGGHLFESKDQAEAVADLINNLTRMKAYYLGGSYAYCGPQGIERAGEPEDVETIKERQYWSQAHYDKHRTEIAAYNEATARYDKLRKEYDGIAGRRKSVAERVQKAIDEASEKKYSRENVERSFARYEEIADGDREQALKFYLLSSPAYPEEFIRDVLGMPVLTDQAEAVPTTQEEPDNGQ